VNEGRRKNVGILSRPDDDSVSEQSGFGRISEALDAAGLSPHVVEFVDDEVDRVRDELLALDGVLVWADPITRGKDRVTLDAVLREVASRGVWVSAHPDVILKMGTKDVLVRTKDMSWGSDCFRYDSLEEMAEQLTRRLATGPRVLKQHRGNGGNGVWKVESVSPSEAATLETAVKVLHAQRGSPLEQMPLYDFLDRCRQYFGGSGCMIDQAYQERLAEGMVRCYCVADKVAGFGHQFVTALLPLPDGTMETPRPAPRLYYGPGKPEFQDIKAKLENEWLPQMQALLDLKAEELPAIWDADFLYGPKDESGRDTYVLCEINVSSVSPFPEEALGPLARVAAERLRLRS